MLLHRVALLTGRTLSRASGRALGAVMIGCVQAYRLLLSPLLPPSCRYLPTCSTYSIEAIRRHGPILGGALTARRLLRCHPWGGTGYDPVPEPGILIRAWARLTGRPCCGHPHHHP